MNTTATIRYEPEHFFAHDPVGFVVPESWTIIPDDGSPIHCDSPEEARAVAERFGYTAEYLNLRAFDATFGLARAQFRTFGLARLRAIDSAGFLAQFRNLTSNMERSTHENG